MRKVTNLLHRDVDDILRFLNSFFFLEERNGSVSIISHCEATTGQWQDNSSFEWSQKGLGREKGEKEREMPTLGSGLIGHIMSQMKRVARWDGPYACRKSSCITEWQKIPEARLFFLSFFPSLFFIWNFNSIIFLILFLKLSVTRFLCTSYFSALIPRDPSLSLSLCLFYFTSALTPLESIHY